MNTTMSKRERTLERMDASRCLRRAIVWLSILALLWLSACATGLSEPLESPNAQTAPQQTAMPTSPPPTITLPDPSDTPTTEPDPAESATATLKAGRPVTLSQINMFDPLTGWAIGGRTAPGDRVLRTGDGGETWQDVTPPQQPAADGARQAAAGYFLDSAHGWIVFHSPDPVANLGEQSLELVVWRTADGGRSWQSSQSLPVEFIGSELHPPLLFFSNADTGWLMARLGPAGMHRYPVYFFHTTDGGSSWIQLSDPYQGAFLQGCWKTGMVFNRSGVGWVTIGNCPSEAFIEQSSDSGLGWISNPLPPPGPDYSGFCDTTFSPILFNDGSGLVAVRCLSDSDSGLETFLYRSSDGGASWSITTYPGGSLYFLDPQHGWSLGRQIFRTQNGGQSWDLVSTVTWDGQFSFVTEQEGWAVAQAESGDLALVHTKNGGTSWVIIDPVVVD